MTYVVKALKERLKWITLSERQATWLKSYLHNRDWFKDSIYDDIFDSQGVEFLELIKNAWGSLRNTAEERERINKARSAWNSYSKKSKNQTYSLPPEATKKVNKLAKEQDITRSKVIVELIMQADLIDKLEGKIRKLLKAVAIKSNDGYSIEYLTHSVSEVLKINALKEKLETATERLREKDLEQDTVQELTEENERLLSKLSEVTTQLNQSKKECVKYQEEAEQAQSEVDELLAN